MGKGGLGLLEVGIEVGGLGSTWLGKGEVWE